MYKPIVKPFAFILIFAMAVSLACSLTGGSSPTATNVPVQIVTATTAATQVTQPTQETQPTNGPSSSSPGLVTSLDGVQAATIQIEAEGTFIDPEVGLMLNAAGRGSGFFISPDGLAITNNHVVTGAALLRIWVGGDQTKEYDARVVAVSECSDLAVIQVDGSNFPYLQWRDGTPNVGLQVYAAGFPLGEPQFSLTQGIISKTAVPGATNWASVNNVLTHDATLNPGNSGGPLVDGNGNLVGVNYAGNQANQYFAIGKTEADKVLKDLEAGTNVTSIGVNGEAVVGTLPDGSDISGIWVASVKSGSPADKAGIEAGDIITQMEGEVLALDGTMETYCKILRSHMPTDTYSVDVLRWSSGQILEGELNGRELTVAVDFFQQQLGNQAPANSSSGTYASYVTVTDNSSSIQVDVPAEWTDVDGSPWDATWTLDNGSQYSFSAAAISASTDLAGYNNGYDTPGVFFAASADLAKIGGYVQLLAGIRGWYESDCTLDGTYDYSDAVYEGKYDLWTGCGSNGNMVVSLAGRPINDPTGFLFIVEVKITSDADLDALDQILATFDITH